jgi:hypothetical protein
MFSEIVQYTQKRVNGINDLERRCVVGPSFIAIVNPHLGFQSQYLGLSNRHASV